MEKYVVGWLAWYEIGGEIREFSSASTTWADLPDDGAQLFIILENNWANEFVRYASYLEGYNYYFRAPLGDDWIYSESNEGPDEILRRYPGAAIKRGKATTHTILNEIRRRASEARKQSETSGTSDCPDC